MEKTTYKAGDEIICQKTEPMQSAGTDQNNNKIAPPLSKFQDYVLKSIQVCKCGEQHFDVGLVSKFGFVRCYKCGVRLDNSSEGEIHWCHSSRFSKNSQ